MTVLNHNQSHSAGIGKKIALLAAICLLFASVGQSSAWTGKAAFRDDDNRRGQQTVRRVDPRLQERLYNIMAPLLRAMDHPEDPRQVRIGITDDQEINAANAGNRQFLVTRGLLEKANDEQLRGVLAHEIAHEDLGHVLTQQNRLPEAASHYAAVVQLRPGTAKVRSQSRV